MSEVRTAAELSLLLRVMNCIDMLDYTDAGVSADAALVLMQKPHSGFLRMSDADQDNAWTVIKARFDDQVKRARDRQVSA